MPAERPAVTGYAQSAHEDQQPDFSQGRTCRPVQIHDEAAGGGNRTPRRCSGEQSTLARAKRSICTIGIVHTSGNEPTNLMALPRLQGAKRHARSLALVADAGYRDCSCRAAEREAESHACKFTLASLPREPMPNPSLKRSANGRPPGPVSGAEHFPQPGPGVLPSSPA